MAINNQIKQIKAGFTLVELSIVLVIVAFLLALSLTVGATRLEAYRYQLTLNRIKLIEAALDSFIRDYSRVPCPAEPESYSISDPSFGWELINSLNATDPCTAPSLLPVDDSLYNNRRGAVPVRSLGLSPIAAVDGWGNQIMYEVNEAIVTSVGFVNAMRTDTATVQRDDIHNTYASADKIRACKNPYYILFSSGSNSSYAYSSKGGAASPTGTSSPAEGTDESSNYDTVGDDDYIQRPSGNVSSIAGSYFDDIVTYKCFWQIR